MVEIPLPPNCNARKCEADDDKLSALNSKIETQQRGQEIEGSYRSFPKCMREAQPVNQTRAEYNPWPPAAQVLTAKIFDRNKRDTQSDGHLHCRRRDRYHSIQRQA